MAGLGLRAGHLYASRRRACRVQGGASFFPAFTVGTPIKIVDGNPSLTEIVTPSNVVINNNTCSIAISPANHHNLPFYLTSATGGLQEAIERERREPGINTIILDSRFYVSVGPSNVASRYHAAIGYSNLGLVDITQTPYVWYQWNGSHVCRGLGRRERHLRLWAHGAVVAETATTTVPASYGLPDAARRSHRSLAVPARSLHKPAIITAIKLPTAALHQTSSSTRRSARPSTHRTTIPLSASTAGLSVRVSCDRQRMDFIYRVSLAIT